MTAATTKKTEKTKKARHARPPASAGPRSRDAVVPAVPVGAARPSDASGPARRRRFLVPLEVEIEVDDRLLADVLTDEWREQFYRLADARDVAAHLAFNLVQDRRLGSLDGFADQPEERAKILDISFEEADVVELPISTNEPKLTTGPGTSGTGAQNKENSRP